MKELKNNEEIFEQPTIYNWQKDATYDLCYIRKLLHILAIWPLDRTMTYREILLRKFTIAVVTFFLMIFLIPHASHTFLIQRDLYKQIKTLGAISFCIMSIWKYAIALINQRGIKICVEQMTQDWKRVSNITDDRQLMIDASEWSQTLTKFCIAFMYGSVMSWAFLLPILEQMPSVLAGDGNVTWVLKFPCYFFVKTVEVSTGNGALFTATFITLNVSLAVMCTIAAGFCSLTAKFVMHAIGQLKILIKYLKLLVQDDKSEEVNIHKSDTSLKFVVIYHLRILRFINNVESTLTGIFFAEVIGCTFYICECGYLFINELKKGEIPNATIYLGFIFSFISNILIYCYLGDQLTEQCQEIGFETYEIDWTQLPLKGNRIEDIGMIIMISQHPPKLTAGKIFELTMESFSSVMKASLAYMNVLLNTATVT